MFRDIEQEMPHYFKYFKGKGYTVLCNCDDPFESNFFKYFTLQFHNLGLKRLIGISYAGSPIAGETMKEVYGDKFDIDTENHGYVVDVNKYTWTPERGFDWNIALEQIRDFPENKIIELEGNGDFRNQESIEYLKEADVVVSNPPFSLFREYVAQLVEYDKKFIILGNTNAVTYKEIFPLIKEGKLFAGYQFNKTMEFKMPDHYVLNKNGYIDENGNKIGKVPAIAWYTNIDHYKRHEILGMSQTYYKTPEMFPKYDNYDAIEVSKVKDIPWDYEGIMGVPITFLDKWNPEQFEILGSRRWSKSKDVIKAYYGTAEECIACKKTLINGKETYDRIFIRNLKVPMEDEEWIKNKQEFLEKTIQKHNT